MNVTAAQTHRSLLRDRRFCGFWAGEAISQFGDRISELALPLIAVTSLHASAGQVALLTAAVWTPNLLAIGLGAWVDGQRHKRRLMVVADLVRAAVLVTLPAVALFGTVSLGQLYVVAVLTGAAGVLFNTAYPSFFAHLVPRSSYIQANSMLSATRSASFVAGPVVGGLLVQALTAPFAVAADALSFVGSAVLVGRTKVEEPLPAHAEDTPTVLARARQGLSILVHHPILRAGLGAATTVNFFTFISGGGLIILFASRDLGLSSGLIGVAFGIGSVGGLIGAVLAPRVSRLIGVGRSIALGAVLFPAPLAIAAAAQGPIWSRAATLALAEFLSAVGVMLFDVNLNSLQTATIPEGMRSRVAGAFQTVNYGIRPVGAITGGALATAFGLRVTLLIAAAGGACSVCWLLLSPIPGVIALSDATSDADDVPAEDCVDGLGTSASGVSGQRRSARGRRVRAGRRS